MHIRMRIRQADALQRRAPRERSDEPLQPGAPDLGVVLEVQLLEEVELRERLGQPPDGLVVGRAAHDGCGGQKDASDARSPLSAGAGAPAGRPFGGIAPLLLLLLPPLGSKLFVALPNPGENGSKSATQERSPCEPAVLTGDDAPNEGP